MKKTTYIFLIALIVSLIAPPAFSFGINWSFLDSAPMRSFNDADWNLFEEAFNNALNKQPDGETLSWKNPATNSHGTFKPLTTLERNNRQCRELEVFSSAGSFTSQGVFSFCEDPDSGKWSIGQ